MVQKPRPGYYASHPEKSNELHLLQLTKTGSFSQAQSAKEQLLATNKGFLLSAIEQWRDEGVYVDYADLLQEASIAFLTAVERFDPKKDASIRTYAKYYLFKVRQNYFDRQRFVDFDEEHEKGFRTEPNYDFASFDLRAILVKAIEAVLTSIEQEVVYMHFLDGMKKREIALVRNCSEARICMVVKNSLPKLKAHLLSIGITTALLELN